MELNSNLKVKNETKEYDADNESQNNFKVKKEIVKNEEHEIELSEEKLQASCYSAYPDFRSKDDFIDDNLDVYKKVKTESQHKELSSDPLDDGQFVVEFTENYYVDEKVDISEVTLRSTEYNHYRNVTIDSEDDNEKPRAFTSKQSNSEHIQRKGVQIIGLNQKIHTCKFCLYEATSETLLNAHINSIHNKLKIVIQNTITNCQCCDKLFPSKTTLDDHLLKEHKKIIKSKIHKCNICFYKSTSKIRLDQHFQLFHNEQRARIHCQFCDISFIKKRSLYNHLLKKHNGKTNLIKSLIHKCKFCSYKTTNKSHLNQHFDACHNKQRTKLKCQFCEKSFVKTNSLDDHMLKKHRNNIGIIKSKIHKCNLCSFQSIHRCHLRKHFNLMHEQRTNINCEYCDKSFVEKVTLDNHLLKQHNKKIKSHIYECNHCSFKTTVISNLYSHFNLKHDKQRTKFNCQFCDKSFGLKVSLDNHLLKEHKKKIKSNIFKCSMCSYQTTHKYHYKSHLNAIHNKQREKRKCQFCSKLFVHQNSLDNHLVKEHDVKTDLIKSKLHICNMCPYKTTNIAHFDRHYNACHNEQRSKTHCQFCIKQFDSQSTLDNHILKQHKNKKGVIKSKIHTCTSCSFQTTSKSGLTKHIDFIHNKEKFKVNCDFCNKSFTNRERCDDHILKSHKDKSSVIKSMIYYCYLCSYQTTFKLYLIRHIHSSHNK